MTSKTRMLALVKAFDWAAVGAALTETPALRDVRDEQRRTWLHTCCATTGQSGDFFYVRYRTTFRTGVVFQDIYLQNLGGTWKVITSLALPAPAG